MSRFDELIDQIKKEDYAAKKQLLELLNQTVRKIRRPDPQDREALRAYVFGEIDVLLKAIPAAENYREKDLIMECEDLILGLVMALCPAPGDVPKDVLAKIQILVKLVEQERGLEKEIDRVFEQKDIQPKDITHLCYLAGAISDEYHRGRLYAGIIHHQNAARNLSDQAKAPMTEFLVKEGSRLLATEELTQDQWENLEYLADAVRYFMDDRLAALLTRMIGLGRNTVSFFAAESLICCGREVPNGIIDTLARDLVYAEHLYRALKNHNLSHLFPKELATEEYLAKSDLVHWLTYPTELGQAPDEIEYIGEVTYLFKKDVYHVFRFRSDSDNLGDDVKGKWLIGWSGTDGGTFSNFDEYALYEKDTVAATLKNIKKKLIG